MSKKLLSLSIFVFALVLVSGMGTSHAIKSDTVNQEYFGVQNLIGADETSNRLSARASDLDIAPHAKWVFDTYGIDGTLGP
jgi:hypothetical protein